MALLRGLAGTVNSVKLKSSCCGDSVSWIAHAFYHAFRVSENNYNRALGEIDWLADEIRAAIIERHGDDYHGFKDRFPKNWISSRRKDCKNYGFIVVAAMLGGDALPYVRAKLVTQPALVQGVRCYRDFIWHLIFGKLGFLSRRSKQSCSTQNKLKKTQRITHWDAAEATERYELATLWIRYALERSSNRARLLERLEKLYTSISSPEECPDSFRTIHISTSGGGGKRSYREAIVIMLRKTGLDVGMMQRIRYILEDLYAHMRTPR